MTRPNFTAWEYAALVCIALIVACLCVDFLVDGVTACVKYATAAFTP